MNYFRYKDSKTVILIKSILFWMLFIGLLILTNFIFIHLVPQTWSRTAYGILGTLSAFLVTWLFLKYEKRTFRELGLIWERQTLFRFLIGLLIGTAILGIIMLILVGFTGLEMHRNLEPVSVAAIPVYLAFIPLALMEEVAFRSYPFLKLNKAFGLRITQITVAIAFALYHILNGWDPLVAFLGPGVWAYVFGLAMVWSGGISLPTGLHVALNILQVVVGMKKDNGSVWLLTYKEGISESGMQTTEIFGILIQLFILIIAIILTERHVRKKINSTDK